ncbi:MAG: PQQ-binding-like beta-propeller repeat protein [Planctomycetota bacterium]
MKNFGCLLAGLVSCWAVESVRGEDWAQFRGGTALSVATASTLPATWKEAPQPAWRTAVEGSGWSQPIVVGERVFVTTAVSKYGKPKSMMGGVMDLSTMGKAPKPKDPVQWRLVCLSLASGEILWQQTVADSVPAFGKHASNTFATETPAASGDTVYTWFGAAGVLAAYSLEGQQKWTKSLGTQKITNDFGTGSSLVLDGDRLFVQLYHDDSATLLCLQAADGAERWKTEREKGSSWATPIIWNNAGTRELVTAGKGSVIAYDLASGAERWRYAGLDTSFSCSVVADDKAVYFGTSSPGSSAPMAAIAAGHTGDLSRTESNSQPAAILWNGTKSGAGMPSPVIAGDYIYFYGTTATCYEKRTGKEIYRKRLPGGTLAAGCPIVVGDKIYLVNELGNILVLATGPQFEVVAELKTGTSGEVYWATPAVAQNSLLVRSSDAVYCYR